MVGSIDLCHQADPGTRSSVPLAARVTLGKGTGSLGPPRPRSGGLCEDAGQGQRLARGRKLTRRQHFGPPSPTH